MCVSIYVSFIWNYQADKQEARGLRWGLVRTESARLSILCIAQKMHVAVQNSNTSENLPDRGWKMGDIL